MFCEIIILDELDVFIDIVVGVFCIKIVIVVNVII